MSTLESICKYYRVDRREIGFLRFLFEAYDGMAAMTTIDAKKGIVVLWIPPGCETEVSEIINDLKKEIMIEPLAGRNPGDIPLQQPGT